MNYQDYLKIADQQYEHLLQNIEEYRQFDNEEQVSPKFLINVGGGNVYKTRELLESPEKMLLRYLEIAQKHIDIGDDYIPQVRVEFGTGQVSHAFGCDMYIPEDSPVCAKNHVLNDVTDIDDLEIPSLDAGWFGKLYEFTRFFMENKPDIMGIQQPDLQSPFNNAHLVRGNDILYDFYDDPERLDILLDKMAEYQIRLIKHYQEFAGLEEGIQYDWGLLWKGNARLSNCSLHMISTQFYRDHIKKHDERVLQSVGGGRIHYCGVHDDGLMDSFSEIENMYGIDFDGGYHDFRELAEHVPKRVALYQSLGRRKTRELLNGDWGNSRKNNVILACNVHSVEEGRELYRKLKESYYLHVKNTGK